jgi:activator of HSP90 ATPase
MKKVEQEKAKAGLVPLKQGKQNTAEGQGSVWNNNSYHWEQKSVDKWADDTLKKVLSLYQFKHERAVLRITEVKDLKGESSVSVRKSKKIVTYDYQVKLLWKCDFGDESNTKVIGSIEGEYFFPELSNDIIDDGEEWEIESSIKQGDESLRKSLFQMVKKWVPDNLRKTIMLNFVDELKKK